jgi:murein DD-endopeptidase MepM/ murein hydrolase activator NlpD
LLLAVYATALCFYGVGYYRKAYQAVLTDRDQVENEDLKRQLAGLQSDLDLAEMRIQPLVKTDEMMRAWTNAPDLGDDIRRLGVGGGESVETEWGPNISPVTAQLLAETTLTLDQLQRRTDFLDDSFARFAKELSKEEGVRRHTPSVKPVPPGTKVWPSSRYGYRTDPFTGRRQFHNGIDYAGRLGDDIIVTADGVVKAVGKDRRLGYFVTVNHGNTFRTVYGHLRSRPPVTKGQQVKRGDVIGKIGNTGRSTGPHLHYSVIRNGKSQNPKNYIFARSNSFF